MTHVKISFLNAQLVDIYRYSICWQVIYNSVKSVINTYSIPPGPDISGFAHAFVAENADAETIENILKRLDVLAFVSMFADLLTDTVVVLLLSLTGQTL